MNGKNLLIVCFLLFGTITSISAQKYEFEYQEKEQAEPDGTVTRHFLGDQIATKMFLLRKSYTYSVRDEISRVDKTEIEKPSIYYSVNKVNKYVKKSIKKGQMTEGQAKETLTKVLDVAINIRYQETEELEKELWSTKDPVAIASIFNESIVMN